MKSRGKIRAVSASVTLLILLGITGCASDGTTSQVRSFLDTEASPEDSLPPNVEMDGIVAESSRRVGTEGDVAYFLTDFQDPQSDTAGVCLVLVNQATEFFNSVCGAAADGLEAYGSETGSARIAHKGDGTSDGWVRVSDFLIVSPDAK